MEQQDQKESIQAAFKGTTLSVRTQNNHVKCLMNWIDMIEDKSITVLVSNPVASMEAIMKANIKHSPENLHIYISSSKAYVHHVLKDNVLEKEWREIQKKNWEPIQERYDENRPSERQQTKVMSLEEVEEVRKSLSKGSFERLLVSFYTMIEPIRADYFATELIYGEEESKEENYILNNSRLIVRDFKTANKYKVIDNLLSEELQEELRVSLELYPRKYLFTKDDKKSPFVNKKMFSNWACKALKRVLKHPMDLTTLRHIYIGAMMKDKSKKELTVIARKMGHSRDMQRVYEWDDK